MLNLVLVNVTEPFDQAIPALLNVEFPLVNFTLIHTSWFWILCTSLCCISPRSSS